MTSTENVDYSAWSRKKKKDREPEKSEKKKGKS